MVRELNKLKILARNYQVQAEVSVCCVLLVQWYEQPRDDPPTRSVASRYTLHRGQMTVAAEKNRGSVPIREESTRTVVDLGLPWSARCSRMK